MALPTPVIFWVIERQLLLAMRGIIGVVYIGNPLFINKNVIEMVALLVLMTTRTGKWFGLDALVSSIFKRS